MKRRDVLRLLAGAMVTVPRGAWAQTPAKTYRLASFTAGSPVPVKSPNGEMLFSALAKNGYRLGQNLEYQPYGAAMQIALLRQLAKDIAANKVDAAVVLGYSAAAALKDTGIPTVTSPASPQPLGPPGSAAHGRWPAPSRPRITSEGPPLWAGATDQEIPGRTLFPGPAA